MALGAVWGLHFSIVKIASESGLPYSGIITLTAVGATSALFLICLARGRLPPMSGGHLRFYLWCSMLSYGIPFVLELAVAKYLAAGLLAIVVAMDPIVTTLIVLAKRTEPLAIKRIAGVAVGAGAALVILAPGAALPTPESFGWGLLALGVPISYALYHNYVVSAWPQDLDSWQAGTGEALVAIIIFLPLSLGFDDTTPLFSGWTSGHWAIVLMILSGVVEAYLYFEVARRAAAVFVSQASFVTVLAGILWGMAIFGERPSGWFWLSVMLVLVGVYLTRPSEGR